MRIDVLKGMPGMPEKEGFWATAKTKERSIAVHSGTEESARAFLRQVVEERWKEPVGEGVVYETQTVLDWRWKPTRCCEVEIPHVHATDKQTRGEAR